MRKVIVQETECKVLEFRVDQLDKQYGKVIDTVEEVVKSHNNLFTGLEMVKKDLKTWLVIGGLVYNTALALALNYLSKDSEYSEQEKRQYYDNRVQESDTIRALREEIERLKRQQK